MSGTCACMCYAVSILLLVSGIVILLYSAMSSSWQLVELREFRAFHSHGLVRYCHKNLSDGKESCNWKLGRLSEFNSAGYEPGAIKEDERHHESEVWKTVVLMIHLCASVFGLKSLVLLLTACYRRKYVSVVGSVILLIAAVFTFAGIVVFFCQSQMKENLIVRADTSFYKHYYGIAPFLAVGAFLCFFFAFILSLPSTLSSSDNRDSKRNQVHRHFLNPPRCGNDSGHSISTDV